MHPAQFGMAFKAGVESANAQGLFDIESVSARIVELVTLAETLSTEFNVEEPSYSGGSRFEEKPRKGQSFEVDGTKWFDYREAKADGTVSAGFPDFKSYEGDGASLWLENQDGSPNADAEALAKAADVVGALA